MIIFKSKEEIEIIGKACKIVAESLALLRDFVKPGMTTKEADHYVEGIIMDSGAKPAFKGYHDFPATLCISVNEEVVHGIPSDRIIQEGDVVGLDLGVIYNGFYGDAAITVPLPGATDEALHLIEVTEQSLFAGIKKGRIGGRLSDISHAIQDYVEKVGYSVVREFVGHGIGRSLHEDPQVPNYGVSGKGPRLREGMVLAIEPMVNTGKCDVSILEDNWTAVSSDQSLSAHFEHTIAITRDGPLILSMV